ncbi:ROK family protein [Limnobaculum zhutongyuii]|uniref:ROK family protein n=1 Tax=Limnobaculum zhutongyuii TaxID=2498113 RepID=A0A411WND2_9GAMM|nr:ROK family transcriptional regulator [Limnobaculum zhutongyuii]QBH97666.1 ROK family protein [Limnobaculum zhutongyuii]TQS86769.1 ROK family protein [Limnobaculum zhutongyuii]
MPAYGLNNQRIRHHNKSVLLEILYREKIASKSTLAKRSQLSIPAVSKILSELEQENKVSHQQESLHARGNSGGSYRITPEPGFILCLNVTPYMIESVLVDGWITPQSALKSTSIKATTPEALLTEIERLYQEYYQRNRPQPLRLALSIHGQVNPVTGVSQNMPQAPWNDPIEIKYLLEERLNTELLIDNDCIMLALAEKWQNHHNFQDFCVINVDYGIGSSFVINHQIYRGSLYGSGQIGHTIIDPDGSQCDCGRYGCLETIASLSALKKMARKMRKVHARPTQEQSLSATPTTEWLITHYHQGDEELRSMVNKAARSIGLSLYNFLNILNINQIYLYGRSCGFGKEWLQLIQEQTGFNPFDQTDTVLINATNISFGHLSRQQQVMGIAYLYVEQALKEMNN